MAIPRPLLERLSVLVGAELGLHFPRDRWRELERAAGAAARDAGAGTAEHYVRDLLRRADGPRDLEALSNRLTVGETYFFREAQAFEALRDHVLPEWLTARQRGHPAELRVWSAGCCTGEEPYSLAIFFDRMCPELRDWGIRIFATDIDRRFLAKAARAVYSPWSFRDCPGWLQEGYFNQVGRNQFQLRAGIRNRVTFARLNLARNWSAHPAMPAEGFDLILCRNVLMYFSPAQARTAIGGFYHCLAPRGHLVVGVCEASSALCPPFTVRRLPHTMLFSKERIAGSVSPQDSVPAASDDSHDEPPPPVGSSPIPETDRPASGAPIRHKTCADIEPAVEHARLLADQGAFVEARRLIDRALAVDRLQPRLHYLRATVLQEEGRLALAAEALNRTLYLEPDFILAHVALGNLARRAGQAARAQRHLGWARRLLRRRDPAEVIPESGGLTAARLVTLIGETQPREVSS